MDHVDDPSHLEKNSLTLFRKQEEKSAILLDPDKPELAVDLFVQQFIFEHDVDLQNQLRIHVGDSAAPAITLVQVARKLSSDSLFIANPSEIITTLHHIMKSERA